MPLALKKQPVDLIVSTDSFVAIQLSGIWAGVDTTSIIIASGWERVGVGRVVNGAGIVSVEAYLLFRLAVSALVWGGGGHDKLPFSSDFITCRV